MQKLNNSRLRALLASVSLLLAAGCFGPRYIRTDPGSRVATSRLTGGLTQHVVLVSIDGLRPDAIADFETPTMKRLIREGSYSLSAITILPSKTLPSHTSMLTGQPPSVHQVLWNTPASLKKKDIHVPTVFRVVRDQGFLTAAFFSKSKFESLQLPGSLDYSQAPGGWFGYWPSDRTVRDIERYMETERPHLLFVHLGDPDHAGHDAGWMSPKYGNAVERVDASLGRIIAVAEQSFGTGNFTLIVTSDHGGHERNHGSNDPRDTTIPWIAWGRGVTPSALARPIETFDTAATVLWLLGVTRPASWKGVPVTEAFGGMTPAPSGKERHEAAGEGLVSLKLP